MGWRTELLVKCMLSFFPGGFQKTLLIIFHVTFDISDDYYQVLFSPKTVSFPGLFFFNLFLQNKKLNSVSVAFPHTHQFPSPFIIFIDYQQSPLVYELILEASSCEFHLHQEKLSSLSPEPSMQGSWSEMTPDSAAVLGPLTCFQAIICPIFGWTTSFGT